MKLKERDKNLLIIIGMALLVFLAYFVGYRNINAKRVKVDAEVEKLVLELANLKSLEASKDTFISDTTEYISDRAALLGEFDSGYSQEYIIKVIENIENEMERVTDDNIGWIKGATFNEPQFVYDFGNITSTNPDRTGELVYTTDLEGYSSAVSMNFEAGYDEFKKMVEYINNYEYENKKCKYKIETLNATYNSEAELVVGSIGVVFYALTGEDRIFTGIDPANKLFGTTNIFHSDIFNPAINGAENGENIISDYDLYLTLQSAESDVAALTLGVKNDQTGRSEIVDEANSAKDVEIRVMGMNGEYKVAYKVGNNTYPVDSYTEGEGFVVGELLSMLVISSERTSIDDASAANVSIFNESDKTLEIKVINEDESNPRFVVKYKEGDIIIYEN